MDIDSNGNIGIGQTAEAANKLSITGNLKVTGDIISTGFGGVGSDKYVRRLYDGDGFTPTFGITDTGNAAIAHEANSVLVSLNGVVQIGGNSTEVTAGTANYYVSGTNVVFGTNPPTGTKIFILELPI